MPAATLHNVQRLYLHLCCRRKSSARLLPLPHLVPTHSTRQPAPKSLPLVGPPPAPCPPAVLGITVAWPTLHRRSYGRYRVPALALLRFFLYAQPFVFNR